MRFVGPAYGAAVLRFASDKVGMRAQPRLVGSARWPALAYLACFLRQHFGTVARRLACSFRQRYRCLPMPANSAHIPSQLPAFCPECCTVLLAVLSTSRHMTRVTASLTSNNSTCRVSKDCTECWDIGVGITLDSLRRQGPGEENSCVET